MGSPSYRETFHAMVNDRKFCVAAAVATFYAFCLVAIGNMPQNEGLCASETTAGQNAELVESRACPDGLRITGAPRP